MINYLHLGEPLFGFLRSFLTSPHRQVDRTKYETIKNPYNIKGLETIIHSRDFTTLTENPSTTPGLHSPLPLKV